ncbi:queosine biosynthesis [Candidatus Photodesmus blepharus]|uniref:7-carboxy-7-deazaguanine synthase n=1 Tax=Candidatus Photodesmus blepharonis TaxID=1179155 RepID=A0A084CM91_9GAMM|nr:7-carboxy-7-deazaguanine synthase QueE [Candidatus Photodesmus blepharus]KEY90920.1 queosine biosynthesis [Candidatus Photodesmus blepharus]
MYTINEIFETIQGEGHFTGTPSVFIRFQKCLVRCTWCDTKQTWDASPKNERTLNEISTKPKGSSTWCASSSQEIVEAYRKQGFFSKHIVITGGEPCIYDLRPLSEKFEEIGCRCQIETSGTSEILTSKMTWVTVSPKVSKKQGLTVTNAALCRANEIKHLVKTRRDIEILDRLLSETNINENTVIALQPMSQNIRATKLCIEICIQRNWKLSVQTHKYLNIP